MPESYSAEDERLLKAMGKWRTVCARFDWDQMHLSEFEP